MFPLIITFFRCACDLQCETKSVSLFYLYVLFLSRFHFSLPPKKPQSLSLFNCSSVSAFAHRRKLNVYCLWQRNLILVGGVSISFPKILYSSNSYRLLFHFTYRFRWKIHSLSLTLILIGFSLPMPFFSSMYSFQDIYVSPVSRRFDIACSS